LPGRLPIPSLPAAAWIAAGALLAGLAAATGLCDPDTWWLIADGNRILAGDFAHTNGYGFAYGGHEWNQVEWLSSVVVALFAKVAGIDNLTLLPVLASALIAVTLADSSRRRSGDLAPALFLALLAVTLVSLRPRLTARADLFSLLLAVLLVNLRIRRVRRFPAWCALVGLLWGNFHPGVFLGAVLLAALAAASLLEKDRPAAASGAAGTLAFLAASLVNPFGWLNYRHVVDTLLFVKGENLLINEMVPPDLRVHLAFVAATAAAVVLSVAALRRRDFHPALLLAAFLPPALAFRRFVPYPVIVLFPFLHHQARESLASLDREHPSLRLRLLLPALFLAVAAAASWSDLSAWRKVQPLEWKVNLRYLPAGSADFVDRYDLSRRVFNDYDQGGYLAWRFHPRRGTFIDGRVPAWPPELMEEYHRAMKGAAAGDAAPLGRLLDRYGVDAAIVQRAGRVYDTSHFDGTFDALGWNLLYLEGAAAVYVRPGSEAARRSPVPPFRILRPRIRLDDIYAVLPAYPGLVAEELSRIDPARVVTLRDYRSYSAAAEAAGRPDLAEAFAREGRSLYPDDAFLALLHGVSLQALGRNGEAREAFLRVVEHPDSAEHQADARARLSRLPP
jgi:hypothetical protein